MKKWNGPLKRSGNRRFSDIFRGDQKRKLGREVLKRTGVEKTKFTWSFGRKGLPCDSNPPDTLNPRLGVLKTVTRN